MDQPTSPTSGVDTIETIRGASVDEIQFKHYELLLAATCVIVVCSNIIGAGKVADVGGFAFGAGVLFFPLSYVLGDVLTEVYGYKKARRAIMAATGAALFAALMAAVITAMPPDTAWNSDLGGVSRQQAFAANFGQAPRIVLASLIALFAGEIANAQVMARMKARLENSALWQRTIGSTAVGQAVDSLLFYPLAFLGVWETSLVITVMITNYLLKVAWEAILTPVTYRVVGALKRSEGVDVIDAPGR
ncbi:MAG: queuosine precursor transporter [Pseudomonadota bacterium]